MCYMLDTKLTFSLSFILLCIRQYKDVYELIRHRHPSFERLRKHVGSLRQMQTKSLHLCLALCDPMDCQPPDSPVHEIL